MESQERVFDQWPELWTVVDVLVKENLGYATIVYNLYARWNSTSLNIHGVEVENVEIIVFLKVISTKIQNISKLLNIERKVIKTNVTLLRCH